MSIEEPGVSSSHITWKKASLVHLVKLSNLIDMLESFVGDTNNWEISWKTPTTKKPVTLENSMWNFIAILQYKDINSESISYPIVNKYHNEKTISKGDTIYLIASPYGIISPSVFMNTIHRGVICNIISTNNNNNNNLYITDCKVLPGMEGGVIVDKEYYNIIGMLLPPINQLNCSSMEFNFILPMNNILNNITNICKITNISIVSNNQSFTNNVVFQAEKSVVLIEIENTWASGIIIKEDGTIVTNAHLFRNYIPPKRVTNNIPIIKTRVVTNNYKHQTFTCDLIYITPFNSYLDLAIIKINNNNNNNNKFIPIEYLLENKNITLPSIGTNISVIGYPLYKPNNKIYATCTTGSLSKIVYYNNKPVIIETNAAVHNGNSGGLLIDSNSGQWLGLVTCNLKQKTSNGDSDIIPRLNFSIPINEIIPVLKYILNGKNEIFLKELNLNDNNIHGLWKLQYDSSEQNVKKQENNKGSEFAKYLQQLQNPRSKL